MTEEGGSVMNRVAFPFFVAHLLSSLMALTLRSVTSMRFYDEQLCSTSFCPSNDCLLTSTRHQHASMSSVFTRSEFN